MRTASRTPARPAPEPGPRADQRPGLQRTDRGVRDQAHDQAVTEPAGLAEQTHVPGVQEIEQPPAATTRPPAAPDARHRVPRRSGLAGTPGRKLRLRRESQAGGGRGTASGHELLEARRTASVTASVSRPRARSTWAAAAASSFRYCRRPATPRLLSWSAAPGAGARNGRHRRPIAGTRCAPRVTATALPGTAERDGVAGGAAAAKLPAARLRSGNGARARLPSWQFRRRRLRSPRATRAPPARWAWPAGSPAAAGRPGDAGPTPGVRGPGAGRAPPAALGATRRRGHSRRRERRQRSAAPAGCWPSGAGQTRPSPVSSPGDQLYA